MPKGKGPPPPTEDGEVPAPPVPKVVAPRTIKCVRKGCSKCLFCMKIAAMCECTEEDKAGDPSDVMYGWCHKCREKYTAEYKNLKGNNCTYCGGGIEDNYPPAGIAAALLLFPIGIVLCCILKERQCVKCNRTAA